MSGAVTVPLGLAFSAGLVSFLSPCVAPLERRARATAVANEIGVRETPSFLVDGNPVQGALPLAEFRRQIETTLLVQSTPTAPRRGTLP